MYNELFLKTMITIFKQQVIVWEQAHLNSNVFGVGKTFQWWLNYIKSPYIFHL